VSGRNTPFWLEREFISHLFRNLTVLKIDRGASG